MKFNSIVLIALIAFSPGVTLADNSDNYRYSGNSVGKQVCRAIVHDDVKQLQRVLRSHRQTLVYAYTFNNLASRALAGSFTCNDLELREFSYNVGAQQVFGYLTSESGTVEEQVVSTGK